MVRHSAKTSSGRLSDDASRRVLSITVAAIGILATLALMLLIALVVRCTSRGPVIYKQRRIGVDRRRRSRVSRNSRRATDVGGRPFDIYKFRTMHEAPGARQSWAAPGDRRVTAVGRVLRKHRLDELPQLFNVLLGEMNVVGPRPEQPELFAELRVKIDSYADRQVVLPGITGWAQITLGPDRSVDDVRHKLALDLEYIRARSTLQDLSIMVRTLPVMLGATSH